MTLKTGTRAWWSIVIVVCLAMVPATPAAGPQTLYDGIVVFGASLSDPGNGFALLGRNATPPGYDANAFLVPSAPYARGGHHLSNGSTWVEQLALSIGLPFSANAALRGHGAKAANYAVGSARAYDHDLTFNLSDQVNAFLADVGVAAPSGSLYVIEMGGNDVRDALQAYATGGDGAPILQAAVLSIAQHITTLYLAGARQFLVMNSPDVGLTPAVRAADILSPGTALFASQVTDAFNDSLGDALALLSLLPGIDITRLDAFQLLHNVVAAPSTFGLTNVTTACITPEVPPFTCHTPDEYLFWDGIHPTAAGHAILADDAKAVLGLQ